MFCSMALRSQFLVVVAGAELLILADVMVPSEGMLCLGRHIVGHFLAENHQMHCVSVRCHT